MRAAGGGAAGLAAGFLGAAFFLAKGFFLAAGAGFFLPAVFPATDFRRAGLDFLAAITFLLAVAVFFRAAFFFAGFFFALAIVSLLSRLEGRGAALPSVKRTAPCLPDRGKALPDRA